MFVCYCSCHMLCWRHVCTLTSLTLSKWVAVVKSLVLFSLSLFWAFHIQQLSFTYMNRYIHKSMTDNSVTHSLRPLNKIHFNLAATTPHLTTDTSSDFYRAMHYSAKCGIVIACSLSVCLSVTLVDQDHIGWKSWKLIARTLSLTPSLFAARRPPTYSQGNMGKFWGD